MAQGNGGGGGGGENKKAEEILPHPHPVEEQLPGIQYCVNSPPPWPEAIVLGFQHYLLTLGVTVLIPALLFLKWVVEMVYFPYPFQWGSPTFNVGETFAMLAASFVSLSESTGTFYAVARYGSATPVPPSVISRGIGWQGIGVLLNGMFGSVTGLTASVWKPKSDTSLGWVYDILLYIWKIWSNFCFYTYASSSSFVLYSLWLCLFCWSWFSSILQPEQLQNKIHIGFLILHGAVRATILQRILSGGFKPGQVQPSSNWFNDIMVVIFMSHATVAAMIALFFDCTLSRENDETRKDSGLKWWEKFSLYNSDVRNDEFYGLPCRLNKLFPAL
ncbi:hypothetical protein LWI29_000412 [Acer saccharum]|uniref:Uncharacterized protein n=1 Tax=Acer saccharum TaxID=4024 RepID=A0AA39RN38_ACESA|nr:hypothetical protein LWI29_000412 [Acer saccharum]